MVWGYIMKRKKGPLGVLEYPGGKRGEINTERYIKQVLELLVKWLYKEMEKEKGPGVEF